MNLTTAYNPLQDNQRDVLIQRHLPLVKFIVERMVTQVPAYMTRDEITSSAMLGLIDAAGRFDAGRGILFKTFAEQRIRGAILDEARRMDWFSRGLREKQGRIAETIDRLEQTFGRSPEEDEVAKAMNLSLDDYRQMLGEVNHLGCISLQETLDGTETNQTFLDCLIDQTAEPADARLEKAQLTQLLAKRLEKLSEKERLVISLYYYEELSQKEISQVLGLTEGRISQLHSQALVKLKVGLNRRELMGG
jgi:RNA polymerase sigma factor for flagellar operon FliA